MYLHFPPALKVRLHDQSVPTRSKLKTVVEYMQFVTTVTIHNPLTTIIKQPTTNTKTKAKSTMASSRTMAYYWSVMVLLSSTQLVPIQCSSNNDNNNNDHVDHVQSHRISPLEGTYHHAAQVQHDFFRRQQQQSDNDNDTITMLRRKKNDNNKRKDEKNDNNKRKDSSSENKRKDRPKKKRPKKKGKNKKPDKKKPKPTGGKANSNQLSNNNNNNSNKKPRPEKPSKLNNNNGGKNKPRPNKKPSGGNKGPNPSNNNNNNNVSIESPASSPSSSYNNNNNNKPSIPASSPTKAITTTIQKLRTKQSILTSQLLMYDDPLRGKIPSVYTFDGLLNGLEVMSTKGVAGKTFYLGIDGNSENGLYEGNMYGLVNVAAFLSQSMKETIKYNACDENSWDLVDGKYPISNACGQLGQSYQDYHCPSHERHMECKVDPKMKITAVTHATWYGAPGPLYCKPKESRDDFTGFWDYMFDCNNPWADPPITCNVYKGQRAGQFDNTIPVANSAGRTDVEGCCFWGRGVIQTTGICNFGKLNYFLGARAAKEGRKAAYPDIDFCKNPEAICSSQEHKELKWIAGMFYWIESLQSYDSDGWNYMEQLHAFVNGGLSDPSFINAVSGIVNRGCHNPPCATGEVDGLMERSVEEKYNIHMSDTV
eukprot:scaffold100636_cov60-Cyclotella_meneghiniana.AAC.2